MYKISITSIFSLLPLLLTIFIDAVGITIVYPLFSHLIYNTSFLAGYPFSKNFVYALMVILYPLGMFFGAFIIGALSDKVGRKFAILLSVIGNACGFFLSGFGLTIGSISVILLSRFISGLTAGCVPVTQAAFIDLLPKEKNYLGLTCVGIANAIGFVFGLGFSGFYSDQNLTFPFWLFTIFGIIVSILIWFFYKPVIHYTKNVKKNVDLKEIINFLKNKKILFISLIFILYLTGYTTVYQYLPVFLIKHYLFNGHKISIFLICFALLFSFSMMVLVPYFFQKFNIFSITLITIVIQLISLLVLEVPITASPIKLYIFIVPFALSSALAYISFSSLISNAEEKSNQGKAMGLIGSITALSWAISPLFFCFLGENFIHLPFLISTMFMFFAFLFLLMNNRQRHGL